MEIILPTFYLWNLVGWGEELEGFVQDAELNYYQNMQQ